MSGVAGERETLRVYLEWLQLAGVEGIRDRRSTMRSGRDDEPVSLPSGSPAPPPVAKNAPQRGMATEVGLFGGVSEAAPAPGRGGRKQAAATDSPILTAKAPAAGSPAEALRLIREELGDCTRCRLCEKRTQIVFGVGSPDARLMFVGEGPGADEDRQGEPFVGRAGQLLNRIIAAMGLSRSEVYIANVVKCRPPENRTPQADEIGTCSPYLFQQIAAIRPRVLVCLGTPAAQTVLGTRSTITHLRGRFHEIAGIQVMATFHPAYLLRNPAAKKDVWEDMRQVMALLNAEG